MHIEDWLRGREGIAHREEVLRAGFSVAGVRSLVRTGGAEAIRRGWIALPDAAADLVEAARGGGRLSCVSLARRRGWWIPPACDSRIHLHVVPGSRSPQLDGAVRHWTRPLVPTGRVLAASVEDALEHIARCMPHDDALVLWESAARVEKLAPESLRQVRWLSRAASALASQVQGLSDSGLETLAVVPLRRRGLQVRQQVVLARKPVDALVGEALVVQIDGYAHHADAAQRAADIAHDAELRLRGYTVIRVGYWQIVRQWPQVERTILRAVAAGLHQFPPERR